MHTPRRRKNNLWHALAGDSGLTSIQWVGLSAVALVTIAVIVGVFAAGGSQEIQQAASTGTDRRIECLYNNCEPWQNDSSGPKAGAAAQASGGASLQTAGDITAEAASDGASLKSDAASRWDRFWKGAGDFLGRMVQFGKNLASKIGELAGKAIDAIKGWWNSLPNWAKGLIIGIGIGIVVAILVFIAGPAILAALGVGATAIGAAVTAAAIVGFLASVFSGALYGLTHANNTFSGWHAAGWSFLYGVVGAGSMLIGAANPVAMKYLVAPALKSTALVSGVQIVFGRPPSNGEVLLTYAEAIVFSLIFSKILLFRYAGESVSGTPKIKPGPLPSGLIKEPLSALSKFLIQSERGDYGLIGSVVFQIVKFVLETVPKKTADGVIKGDPSEEVRDGLGWDFVWSVGVPYTYPDGVAKVADVVRDVGSESSYQATRPQTSSGGNQSQVSGGGGGGGGGSAWGGDQPVMDSSNQCQIKSSSGKQTAVGSGSQSQVKSSSNSAKLMPLGNSNQSQVKSGSSSANQTPLGSSKKSQIKNGSSSANLTLPDSNNQGQVKSGSGSANQMPLGSGNQSQVKSGSGSSVK